MTITPFPAQCGDVVRYRGRGHNMIVVEVMPNGVTAVVFCTKQGREGLKIDGFPTGDLVKVLDREFFPNE